MIYSFLYSYDSYASDHIVRSSADLLPCIMGSFGDGSLLEGLSICSFFFQNTENIFQTLAFHSLRLQVLMSFSVLNH